MSRYLDDRRDAVPLLGDIGDERGPSLYDLLQRHLHLDDTDVAVLKAVERQWKTWWPVTAAIK